MKAKRLLSLILALSMLTGISGIGGFSIFAKDGIEYDESNENFITQSPLLLNDKENNYSSIMLSIPEYAQRANGDCGIVSVSMIEGYYKGYSENDILTVYNAVYEKNDNGYSLQYNSLGLSEIPGWIFLQAVIRF